MHVIPALGRKPFRCSRGRLGGLRNEVTMELFYVAFWGVLTVGGAMIGMLMLVITIYVLTR